MLGKQEVGRLRDNVLLAIAMLRAIIDGESYEVLAGRFGVSRTAVERRIKVVAFPLTQAVGVSGLKEEGAAFVRQFPLCRTQLSKWPVGAPDGAIEVVLARVRRRAGGRYPRCWREQRAAGSAAQAQVDAGGVG